MSSSTENTEQTETAEEPDLLAEQAGAGPRPADQVDPETAAVAAQAADEKDLVDDAELRSLMAAMNPLVIKDISTIEKGVEHFFLFSQSHLALIRTEQMKYLTRPELQALQEKRALVLYQYVDLEENGALSLRDVIIRPASLKGDQVGKVKKGCVRGSVVALLRYINRRDENLLKLEQEGELGRWVSDSFIKTDEAGRSLSTEIRQDLNELMANLKSLSFEHLLEKQLEKIDETLLMGVLTLLRAPHEELEAELGLLSEVPAEASRALHERVGQPILMSLNRDFHLLTPPSGNLIELRDNGIKYVYCELEWIQILFTQLARKVLLNILPDEESGWINQKHPSQGIRLLAEMKKHPSLTAGEWSNGADFMQAYEAMLKKSNYLKNIRREFLVEKLMEQAVERLNMQFEPILFNMDEFQAPEAVSEIFKDPAELYKAVVEKIKGNPEVLSQEERRGPGQQSGLYMIYSYNVPRSFIRNKKRRNFLHLMARENNNGKGIYGYLREVSQGDDPPDQVSEQIALSRAIREWEDDMERERRKRELAGMGLFKRLWLWFLGLFGMEKHDRREEDRKKRRGAKHADQPGTNRGVLVGPSEKNVRMTQQVQKAADYVERKNNGIIWLDEVITALASVKYTDDVVGDMLFYDSRGLYVEVRPLVKIRRLFLKVENESDPAWLQATLDYLDNKTNQGPEHIALKDYLRDKLSG